MKLIVINITILSLEPHVRTASTDSASVPGLYSDVPVFSPERTPTVSNLPIADPSADKQSIMVTKTSATAEYPSLILPPSPSINMHNNRTLSQSLAQC